MQEKDNKKVLYWYAITFLLVWLMVIVGGLTRLTHSGLSIVEWKPITGIIPPLSLNDWVHEFQKYQQSPEFLKINTSMTIDEFKCIYWMEFFHRFLARIMGLFFIVPLIFLWRRCDPFIKRQSLMILSLGALQGFMGWYMVKSGLVNEPMVSPYRLTMHLSLAFILMGFLVRGMQYVKKTPTIYTKDSRLLKMTLIFIVLTILYGGLVAGNKAGLIYNTFPLMDGAIIPSEFLDHKPFWINFFNNHATIQWMHRFFAISSFIHVILFYVKNKNKATFLWILLLSLQFILGILTLLYQVPINLGTIHQGLGALLFSYSVWIWCSFKE
jgi:cytochrome c oxidase assembly protein subunit 15